MTNVSSNPGHFFQTDAELEKQKEKEKKYNYTAGNAVKTPSKVLALKVSQGRKYCYIAESAFTARKINLEVTLVTSTWIGCTAMGSDH
jgi:hypothetical protein